MWLLRNKEDPDCEAVVVLLVSDKEVRPGEVQELHQLCSWEAAEMETHGSLAEMCIWGTFGVSGHRRYGTDLASRKGTAM